MAAKEMYDYLSEATPDSDVTLSVNPQQTIVEESEPNQIILRGDDGVSKEIITLSNEIIFFVNLQWPKITPADAGTIMDFYFDSAKGDRMAKTFYWVHTDGHTYVASFACKFTRNLLPTTRHGIVSVRLEVVGKKLDA